MWLTYVVSKFNTMSNAWRENAPASLYLSPTLETPSAMPVCPLCVTHVQLYKCVNLLTKCNFLPSGQVLCFCSFYEAKLCNKCNVIISNLSVTDQIFIVQFNIFHVQFNILLVSVMMRNKQPSKSSFMIEVS